MEVAVFFQIYSARRRILLQLSQTVSLESSNLKALLFQVRPREVKGPPGAPPPLPN